MPETTVTYDVKDLLDKSEARTNALLAEIKGKVDIIATLLGTKADREDVELLRGRIENIERKGSDVAQQASKAGELLDQRLETLEADCRTKKELDRVGGESVRNHIRRMEAETTSKLEKAVEKLEKVDEKTRDIQNQQASKELVDQAVESVKQQGSRMRWMLVGMIIEGLVGLGGLAVALFLRHG